MTSISQPTRTNLGIRSASDAFTLFEAVRQGILPLRRHRLSQAERDNLASGQVFVWIESSEADGLERWTDGRKWSPSRTRDVFLVYEERDEPSVDENLEKASRRINTYFSGPTGQGSEELFGIFAFPKERPPKPDGLMKQTFSAWVLTSSTGQRVKWHMSAYLSRTKGAELPTVQDDPLLQSIQVPAGIFECCTGPRKHRKPFATFHEGGESPSSSPIPVQQMSNSASTPKRHSVPLGIDSDALSRSSLMRGRKCSTSSRTSTFSSSSLPSPPSSPTWNMKPLPSGQEDLSHRIVHINPRTPSTPHAAHSLLTPRLSHLPKEPVKPASWMAEQLTPISTPRPSVPPDSRDGLSYEMCPRTPSYGHLQSSASHTQSSNHTREYRIASVSNDFLPVINDFQTRSFTPQHYHTPQQNLTYPLHGPSPISASDPGPISYAPRTAADREALASFGQIF